jgi:hypothetical protein
MLRILPAFPPAQRAARRPIVAPAKTSLLLSVIALIAVLMRADPAGAQAGPVVDSLDVALWPEYDRDAVLVIYRLELSPETSLPTRVTIPIPAAVGEPYAVATRAEDGQLFVADFTREADGDWAELTVEVDALGVQVEFYDEIAFRGDQREYTLTWPGGLALGAMSYEAQQPFGVNDLAVRPPGVASVRADGLTYLEADLGPQEAASSVEISLSYSKSIPGLTIDALQPTGPLEPSGAGSPAGPSWMQWLPWVAGGAGVVLLVGGALWYWRMNQAPTERRTRSRRRAAGREAEGEIDASPVYCHNCGAQAAVSDRFCRRCGMRLRQ